MKTHAVPVYNQTGKQIKKIELDKVVFDGKVNQDIIYQVVLMYRASQRKGLASTKTRSEVSGGGAKPWRQKGTGRARVGSIRSPLWRKGGVTFGPHPRDYSFRIPKKMRLVALKSSLNAKLNEESLVILDDLKIDKPKTKEAVKILSNLKMNNQSVLLLLDNISDNIKRSFRNISYSCICQATNTNALQILGSRKLMVNLDGLNVLVNRIKGKSQSVPKQQAAAKSEK